MKNLYGLIPLTFQVEIGTDIPLEDWCYELKDIIKKGKIPYFDITFVGVDPSIKVIGLTNFYVNDVSGYVIFTFGGGERDIFLEKLSIQVDYYNETYSVILEE